MSSPPQFHRPLQSSLPSRTRHGPTTTPSTSPSRRPLHERSKSQNNASPPRSLRARDSRPYKQSIFPQLPSQIFPPDSGPLLFSNPEPPPETVPAIPQKSPRRSSVASTFYNSDDADSDVDAPPVPPIKPLSTYKKVPRLQPLDSPPVGKVQSDKSNNVFDVEPLNGKARNWQEVGIVRKPAPAVRRYRLAPAASSETFASRRRRENIRARESAERLPRLQHKGMGRITSQSNTSGNPRAQGIPATESSTPPSARPEPPSSSERTTDSFIKALIEGGANVQYPTIRKPSVNSMRTDASARSTRPIYPPPLRLQRKRANPDLGKTLVGADVPVAPRIQAYNSLSQTQRLRPAASQASLASQATMDSSGNGAAIPFQYLFDHNRLSGNYQDEAGDIVPDLQPPARLRHQRSDLRSITSDPRPLSQGSSSTTSFYNFCNDSSTAWAHVYYPNESRIQLEAPPTVTNVSLLKTIPQQLPTLQPSPVLRSQSSPVLRSQSSPVLRSQPSDLSSTQSPGSAGFPDTLYVRRLRAHQAQSSQAPTVPTFSTRSRGSSWATTNVSSPSPTFPATPSLVELPIFTATPIFRVTPNFHQNISMRPVSASIDPPPIPEPVNALSHHPVTPPHNPTRPLEPIPHLSPDKNTGDGLSLWRAPSLEEGYNNPFDRLNRQITFFCLGFLLPPSWWIAAFLPLPTRPKLAWAASADKDPEMREAQGEESRQRFGHTSMDLFIETEVRRWQKARWWRVLNRFMSIVGLLVVAAVIAVAAVVAQ